MTITYILQLAWIVIFAFLVITTFIVTVFWGLCNDEPQVQKCIDLTQFSKFQWKEKKTHWQLLITNKTTIFDFLMFFFFRIHVSRQREDWRPKNLRYQSSEIVLSRLRWKGWSDVHSSDHSSSARCPQFGTLFDVSISKLRTHSRPREVSGTARTAVS